MGSGPVPGARNIKQNDKHYFLSPPPAGLSWRPMQAEPHHGVETTAVGKQRQV